MSGFGSRRTHRKQLCALIGVALFSIALPALAQSPTSHANSSAEAYVIGVPDLLRITVWQNPELTVEAPVRRDGKISVPLADDVQAAGRTPMQLKDILTKALSRFIADPYVTVAVTETKSHAVTVIGAVKNSERFSLVSETRVLDAIALVGGFTTWAKKNQIRIIRQAETGPKQFVFNYHRYSAGDDLDDNIVLEPGDVVVIPE